MLRHASVKGQKHRRCRGGQDVTILVHTLTPCSKQQVRVEKDHTISSNYEGGTRTKWSAVGCPVLNCVCCIIAPVPRRRPGQAAGEPRAPRSSAAGETRPYVSCLRLAGFRPLGNPPTSTSCLRLTGSRCPTAWPEWQQIMGLHAACCMLHAACCMLHAACCMLHVAADLGAACCMAANHRDY